MGYIIGDNNQQVWDGSGPGSDKATGDVQLNNRNANGRVYRVVGPGGVGPMGEQLNGVIQAPDGSGELWAPYDGNFAQEAATAGPGASPFLAQIAAGILTGGGANSIVGNMFGNAVSPAISNAVANAGISAAGGGNPLTSLAGSAAQGLLPSGADVPYDTGQNLQNNPDVFGPSATSGGQVSPQAIGLRTESGYPMPPASQPPAGLPAGQSPSELAGTGGGGSVSPILAGMGAAGLGAAGLAGSGGSSYENGTLGSGNTGSAGGGSGNGLLGLGGAATAGLGLLGAGAATSLLGQPSVPASPDFSAAAIAQAKASTPNVNTPFGNRTVTWDNGVPTINSTATGIPAAPVNPGMTGQNAIMSRLAPQIAQQDAAFETQMRNQGLVPGGEAYNNAARVHSQGNNDLLTQAALQGITLDTNANANAFNQYNLSGAGGNQGVAPTPLANAAQSQATYNQGLYGLQASNNNAFAQGLSSLGSSLLGNSNLFGTSSPRPGSGF